MINILPSHTISTFQNVLIFNIGRDINAANQESNKKHDQAQQTSWIKTRSLYIHISADLNTCAVLN